jgi:L-aspartate oxidase
MRYLLGSEIEGLPTQSAEIVIVGSGVAGLRSALALSEQYSVTIVTKASIKDSNTNWAQGGIASVLQEEDSYESHLEDTLEAGAGLCNESRVKELVREGPTEVEQLMDWGANFDTEADGSLSFGREGGHSRSRIIHGRGDATGSLVEDTLVDQVRSSPTITVYENTMMVDILADDERAYGLVVKRSGEFELIWFRALLLASGGMGQLFRETTNHDVVTGDGMAAGFRSGFSLKDIEFVQFHPTTLYVAGGPRFLISEAVRGAGAILVDVEGNRFMEDVHPMMELAPRDIVSRAILERMIEPDSEYVHLDARDFTEGTFSQEFPTISETCQEYGINPALDKIPVRPCAHYSMGGIPADLSGQTSQPNVFAVGEVSCTGVHGANRLASNSLLEGLVMGSRMLQTLTAKKLPKLEEVQPGSDRDTRERRLNIEDLRRSLESLMWRQAGILRNGEDLARAENQLSDWLNLLSRHRITEREEIELANLMMLGRGVVETALQREESRGAHFREDFTKTREIFQKHSFINYSDWSVNYESE